MSDGKLNMCDAYEDVLIMREALVRVFHRNIQR